MDGSSHRNWFKGQRYSVHTRHIAICSKGILGLHLSAPLPSPSIALLRFVSRLLRSLPRFVLPSSLPLDSHNTWILLLNRSRWSRVCQSGISGRANRGLIVSAFGLRDVGPRFLGCGRRGAIQFSGAHWPGILRRRL